MTILDQLAEHARERVEIAKQSVPPAQLKHVGFYGNPKRH